SSDPRNPGATFCRFRSLLHPRINAPFIDTNEMIESRRMVALVPSIATRPRTNQRRPVCCDAHSASGLGQSTKSLRDSPLRG
ncbi:MAG TPA: hypothetical protein VN926_04640, partial [Bradyrhizobium sp.]|nr:hypothetical protein [Bradyrhizobium sp.]